MTALASCGPVAAAEGPRGGFGRLHGWLAKHIYCHGQRYPAAELCRTVTGQALSHKPLLTYLRGKYAALYGIG